MAKKMHKMLRTFRLAFTLWIAFCVAGCDSSLTEQKTDGGLNDGGTNCEAEDHRKLPVDCTSTADCDDSDPCTTEICQNSTCHFTANEIALRENWIQTKGSALSVVLRENRIYVAEEADGGVDGGNGVEIFNISNLKKPKSIGFAKTKGIALAVDVLPNGKGFAVAEGEMGIETFDSTNFKRQKQVQSGKGPLKAVDDVRSILLGKKYAVASSFDKGAAILAGGTANITGAGHEKLPGRALNAAIYNNDIAFVACSLGGAVSLNLQKEEKKPKMAGRILTEGRVLDVAVSQDTALMAEYGVGFSIVDYFDAQKPQRLYKMPSDFPTVAVSLLGPQTGVTATKPGTISVFSLIDPCLPKIMDTWEATGEPLDLNTWKDRIAVALGSQGVVILETGCTPENDSSK